MEKAAALFQTKLIGSEEVINQRDALAKIHEEWLKQKVLNLPEALHHYTTTDGFYDIVSTGKLFATNIMYLNDHTEYVHAIAMMHQVLDNARNSPLAKIVHDPLSIIKDTLNTLKFENIPPVFVTCFSEARNELTQWRSYGHGEGGISLGLNTKALFGAARLQGIELHPVEYDRKRQWQLVQSLIEWGCNRIGELAKTLPEYVRPDWAREWVTQFTYQAAYFAPLFKNAAFSREDEWRVLKWCTNPEEIVTMKSTKGLRLRTVLDLSCDFVDEKETVRRLPVQEVVIGPNTHMPLAKMAVIKHLERFKYYGVNVTPSDIPYRSM